LRIREQETHLALHEHDDDDDDVTVHLLVNYYKLVIINAENVKLKNIRSPRQTLIE